MPRNNQGVKRDIIPMEKLDGYLSEHDLSLLEQTGSGLIGAFEECLRVILDEDVRYKMNKEEFIEAVEDNEVFIRSIKGSGFIGDRDMHVDIYLEIVYTIYKRLYSVFRAICDDIIVDMDGVYETLDSISVEIPKYWVGDDDSIAVIILVDGLPFKGAS